MKPAFVRQKLSEKPRSPLVSVNVDNRASGGVNAAKGAIVDVEAADLEAVQRFDVSGPERPETVQARPGGDNRRVVLERQQRAALRS